MCGEIDDNVQVGLDLQEQFRAMGRMLGLAAGGGDGQAGGPRNLAAAEGRAAYMEELFRAGMRRALSDANAAEHDEAVDAIACQAIAFARLAGFIAGQLPPEADLFRPVIEAVTAGHAETARIARRYQQEHDHHHDHHHHPHGHSH
ncbi:hypothetical protein [Actibacterium sp. MT2.3-13A]|uniref:hypothetical protein n=1 Tax=Actibacterium sp. MT2.3-13A TaxID=2828332 RepID=UPI001BA743F5|nr:hypothetical protein [Actibacterium sp. MT2.3-13A]